MQKSELLFQTILAAAEATGLPVDSDRPAPANSAELPMAIVRRGMLRPEPKSAQTWARHWVYSPVVELWVSSNDADGNRMSLNAALEAFVVALEDTLEANRRSMDDEPILAPGTHPDMIVAPVNVVNDTRIRGYAIDLELRFER